MSKPLFLSVKERMALYESYMPFLKHGGLFVPTDADYAMGEDVSVLVELPNEPAPERVEGKVVWITPEGAQGGRVAGIGVGFNAGGDALRRKVETCLAGTLEADRRTHTL